MQLMRPTLFMAPESGVRKVVRGNPMRNFTSGLNSQPEHLTLSIVELNSIYGTRYIPELIPYFHTWIATGVSAYATQHRLVRLQL